MRQWLSYLADQATLMDILIDEVYCTGEFLLRWANTAVVDVLEHHHTESHVLAVFKQDVDDLVV